MVVQCEWLAYGGVYRYSTAIAADAAKQKTRKGDDEKSSDSDSDNDREPAEPTSPIYNITLSPLSPEMLENRGGPELPGNQLPLNPPGVTQVSCLCWSVVRPWPSGHIGAAALINIWRKYATIEAWQRRRMPQFEWVLVRMIMHKKLSTHFYNESNCRDMRSKIRDNSVRSSACPCC